MKRFEFECNDCGLLSFSTNAYFHGYFKGNEVPKKNEMINHLYDVTNGRCMMSRRDRRILERINKNKNKRK